MIELMSLILSAISVLQAIKDSKSDEDRVKKIREGFREATGIYDFAAKTKKVHNEFQSFQIFFVDKFNGSDNPLPVIGDSTNAQKSDLVRRIVDAANSLVRFDLDEFPAPVGDDNIAEIPTGMNPSPEVRIVWPSMPRKYAEMRSSLEQFRKCLSDLKTFQEDDDFGKEFENTMVLFGASINRTLGAADQLIRDVIPIMSWVYDVAIMNLEDK